MLSIKASYCGNNDIQYAQKKSPPSMSGGGERMAGDVVITRNCPRKGPI